MTAGGDSYVLSLPARTLLLFCAESTTLLNVIDEYFSVSTLFMLVLPVQVRGQCSKKTGLHLTQTVSVLCPACLYLDLFVFLLNSYIIIRFRGLQLILKSELVELILNGKQIILLIKKAYGDHSVSRPVEP